MRVGLNFNHLECFLVTAKSLSFSRSAEILNIAQPAVSKQIKNLEEYLGAQLFLRNKRAIVLTKTGQDLYDKTRHYFSALCFEVDKIKSSVDELSGSINLATLSEVGKQVFTPILIKFQKKYPKIKVHIHFLKSREISKGVRHGDIDIGIVADRMVYEDLKSFKIVDEEVFLVARPKIIKNYQYGNILDCSFVAYRENDPLLMLFFKKNFKKVSQEKLNIAFTVNSHASMVKVLKSLPLFAVLPYLSIKDELKNKTLQIAKTPGLKNILYLVQRDLDIPNSKIEVLKKFIFDSINL